jgi:hypothetical protein
MNKPTHKRVVHGLLVGLLGSLLGLTGTAFAQLVDVEPNDTAADAQLLCIPSGGVTVSANMGNGATSTSELDIFAFDATAGDAPNIGVVTDLTWDSLLVLYDANGIVVNMNDDYMGDGSYTTDSRIDTYKVLNSGRYFAAVVSVPNYLQDNFSPVAPNVSGMGGSYTLDISGVTASATTASTGGTAAGGSCSPVVESDPPPPPAADPIPEAGPTVISMEVLHWRNQDGDVAKRWKHHLKRKGKRAGIYPIPVVMFSSDTFAATDIDPNTLTFGTYGDEASLFRCSKRGMDINKDGRMDLVCFFDGFKTGFDVGDVQGLLNGETVDGEAFTSSASLKVFKVSKDKKHKHWRKSKHHEHGKHHRHGKHHSYERTRYHH